MFDNLSLSLPFTDPVLIFSIVLLIILFTPILLHRIKLPGIIGLILAGVIFGPHGLGLLARDASFELFGTVGLLYIMFLAGLELDMAEFKKNSGKSLLFGFLTFIIPQGVGTLVSYYLLGFSWPSSILLASMFASHTLIAYPIVSRLGITKTEVVTIVIGGTLFTNIVALVILSVITSMTGGDLNQQFWIQFGVSLAIYSFLVLWGIPKLGKWFFRTFEGEGGSHYIFVLSVVFIASYLARVAGIEPIIGAFLAGIALNKFVPSTSALMNRIEFIGNILFIPFFLIGVGMLVNLVVFFTEVEAIVVALVMLVIAIGGKWVAAFLTRHLFKYSKTEQDLIFGLSAAQAASTLAAVMIGFDLGLLNENVLNGTVLMILGTCLASSIYTEKAGRLIAIRESDKETDFEDIPERIMVPISNPNTIEHLIDLAIMIKDPDSDLPIYPLTVVKDNEDSREQVMASNKMLEKAIKHASATENTVHVVSRIDLNIASGIVRAMKELMITEVVMGWNGKITTREKIFGSVLDNLLNNTEHMILVSKILHPLNTTRKIVVVVPQNAEFEIGFYRWVRMLKILTKQTGAELFIYASEHTIFKLEPLVKVNKPAIPAKFEVFEDWRALRQLRNNVSADDLFIMVSARNYTISHNMQLDVAPRTLSKEFEEISFVIIFPEQIATKPPGTIFG